ncbi:ABC transporter substrate-binding protein [Aurantiacibacter poecillastricola]|uniref:ABC transporter substrate-binding protein n=1 Tax=Aurantiacibacter poecillastricola TaxID=3064385 RepID=UPI00273E5641|nr:ABC transporter substrate-binding protein [Aurantiacibacter sp. 219JJ12-13]MDP5263246.1 ABC transporter substrate-binding protein [Aurantiacibacter sp. 219JJ12-13]
MTTFEIAPVLLAIEEYYPGPVTLKMGGVPNLYDETSGSGEPGHADAATNAETQLLRISTRHPDVRAIMTISEGLYRIVARRSAGIESVADLRGKRIATIAQTSSGYFLHRMLEEEGLSFDDITAVPLVPLSRMAEALENREVDAVVIWEPHSEHAARVLGDDIIEFEGTGVYRELFNFNTTQANLDDPAMRARIVRMTRAIIDAAREVRGNPERAQELLRQTSGHSSTDIDDAWEHHAFPASIPDDFLDVLVAEEQWLAQQEDREPRSRQDLSVLLDRSVYEEALALEP